MTIIELRKKTGMNRNEFAEVLEIPIRTLQDWELKKRTPPQYIVKFIEFYLYHNNLIKNKEEFILKMKYNKNLFDIQNGILVKYNGTHRHVIIPEGVTQIGNYAFVQNCNIKTVKIPNSVTSIGERAFFNCMNLENLLIPDNVTSIGAGAFGNCRNFSAIKLPEQITVLSTQLFLGCSELISVDISKNVTAIEKGAFYCCEKLCIIDISDNIAHIGNRAFFGCDNLTKITKNNIASINESALLK